MGSLFVVSEKLPLVSHLNYWQMKQIKVINKGSW